MTRSLSSIVDMLRREIRERSLLDHQLAAAVEQHDAAHHASLHDALTGLPNRELFNDRLDYALGQARRRAWPLALMFIDLDDFKSINDEHGHGVGDAVLQAIAERLKADVRSEDSVCRQGGDEFMYLALGARTVDDVATVAAKLLQLVQAPCTVVVNGVASVLVVRASVGISRFPANGTSAEQLTQRADTAMYRAKRSRTGYAFAD